MKLKYRDHIFKPGHGKAFEGTDYCKFCHYSRVYANKNYCPKRRLRGPKRITDKQRLDWLEKQSCNINLYPGADEICIPSSLIKEITLREAIDAAIWQEMRKP